MTFYTKEDLEAVLYVNHIDNNTALYRDQPVPEKLDTLEEQVAHYESQMSPLNLQEKGDDLTYFYRHVVPDGVATYQRGKALSETVEVLVSRTHTVLGEPEDELARNRAIVSPIETRQAGYVAMSPRWYYVCLAIKSGTRQELEYYAEQANAR